MASDCDCSCTDVESAALRAHLHCLKKHWNLKSLTGVEAECGQLLLRKVARHEQQSATAKAEQITGAKNCSDCLTFLFEAGVELSTEPPKATYQWHALSSAAAAGCVACLDMMLKKLLVLQVSIPFALCEEAVGVAASCHKLDTLKALLDSAPSVRLANLQQRALLKVCSSATSYYSDTECSVFYAEAQAIIEHLLDRQLDVNMATSCPLSVFHLQQSATALGCISGNGCIEAVRWLIEIAGADVNGTWGNNSNTVLHAIAERPSRSHDEDMISTLVSLGADISKRTRTASGDTVLHTAIGGSNLVALKAFVAVCNREESSAEQSQAALIARQNDEGSTALHTVLLSASTRRNCYNQLQWLNALLTCSDSSLTEVLLKQDSTGKTVLHLAVQLRQLDEAEQLLAVCQRLGLLDHVLNIADCKGQSLITLVRCMGGEDLKALVQPYCAQGSAYVRPRYCLDMTV
eukprot:730-Heterococcus_DN1.PRE.1